MRKYLLAIASIFLLLLGFADSASAQSPLAVLSVSSGSGDPGDTGIGISVSLASEGGAEVSIVNFDLNFDPSRLAIAGVSKGSAAEAAGKAMNWSEPSSGKVRVIIYDPEPSPETIGDGALASISFNVLASASPGTSDLTLTGVTVGDLAAQPVPHAENDGTFTVNAPPVTDTPTPTATSVPPSATATSAPSSTSPPTATNTQPAPSATRTATRTNTPSGAATNTPEPSNTPTAAVTSTGTQPASSTPTPTGSLTPTPDGTAEVGDQSSPTTTVTASMTPSVKGGISLDLESAAAATGTALAEFDAAIAATSTALAPTAPPQSDNGESSLPGTDWLDRWGDVLLLAGLALGATGIVAVLVFRVWRRPAVVEEPDLAQRLPKGYAERQDPPPE